MNDRHSSARPDRPGSEARQASLSEVLYVVNSVFGMRNNVGFRPYAVCRHLGVRPRIFARGSIVRQAGLRRPLPGHSLMARGLNLLRIKLLPSLPARQIEMRVFDWACLVRSMATRRKPRLVHLWDNLPRTAAYWKKKGVPLVLDVHMAHPKAYNLLCEREHLPPSAWAEGSDPLLERCLELADLVVCPSEYVVNTLPEDVRDKALVVPFGADPVPPGEQITTRNDRLTVLFAGAANYRKGVPYLVDAWRALAPANAELHVCGRIYKELGRFTKTAPPNVYFHGFQADMDPWWRNADIFVLPSLNEGSAKAVYEAMSYGLPVIVSTHTGSIVEEGVEGFVVPPADREALKAALGRLLADPALRRKMGVAGRRKVSRYTWEAYAHNVLAAYSRL